MNRVHVCIVAAAVLTGCFGEEVTEFPEGLEPLGESAVMGPGTESDPFPEEYELEVVREGSVTHIHGRGYIHAPINDVWTAYQNPAVGADRRTDPNWMSDPIEDEMYDASYIVHHFVDDIVDVNWGVTWRHGLVEGTYEAPELVAIRWRKTEGSTLISRIDGSILLRPVNDGQYTEVELIYLASAAGSGPETYVQYMQDVYDDAVRTVNGEELPALGE